MISYEEGGVGSRFFAGKKIISTTRTTEVNIILQSEIVAERSHRYDTVSLLAAKPSGAVANRYTLGF